MVQGERHPFFRRGDRKVHDLSEDTRPVVTVLEEHVFAYNPKHSGEIHLPV